ncbi:predicted protein [Nematostella vectensis]|uniref:Sulfatase N-terminal domain-containing protein n=1 Tax=Nematostella vectensis TaxID=45351 RepID=A7SBG5_NEMVE|nr:predicted protein [Nematostella vectensis]|eukprot:XP_001631006.1 predicted protein [Nematostella vectensis]
MKCYWILREILLGLLVGSFAHVQGKKPHIIIIVADDLGWDDVSFHGSPQIPTPYIDFYANRGVILNNYYVSPMCTPSRASMMTGKYPINLGMWHLGFFTKEYTPVYRGFDSFYGFWNAKTDYWNHSSYENNFWGVDLRDNMEPVQSEDGTYGTELFTREAVKVIEAHDTSTPLFLYVAHQAVHTANPNEPLQAPQDKIDVSLKQRQQRFKGTIDDDQRQVYAAMVTSLDQSVGDIFAALSKRHMLRDSVVIFTTDNGGAPYGLNWNRGSNFPLRGGKDMLWEGGVKGVAFVYSDLIKQKGRVSKELIDVTDWVPTIYHLAGGTAEFLVPNMDGKNVWSTISEGAPSPRDEILHNIDPWRKFAGLRKGKYKIVQGMDDTYKGVGWYDRYPGHALSSMKQPELLPGAVIDCKKTFDEERKCDSSDGKFCLFDMEEDPCEYHDLSNQLPEVLAEMKTRLEYYKNIALPPWFPPINKAANPANFGGFWSPWKRLKDKSSVINVKRALKKLKQAEQLKATADLLAFNDTLNMNVSMEMPQNDATLGDVKAKPWWVPNKPVRIHSTTPWETHVDKLHWRKTPRKRNDESL